MYPSSYARSDHARRPWTEAGGRVERAAAEQAAAFRGARRH
ncbi:hypothetical protein NKH77_45375 [Streptomyces sp. M19]